MRAERAIFTSMHIRIFSDVTMFECDDSLPPVLRDDGVIWLPLREVPSKGEWIFDYPPEMKDVVQGFHGGYFLPGIISLINTENENIPMFYMVPVDDELEYTFYKKDGTKVIVSVNTELPTKNEKLVFAQAPNNRFWCPMLEKAYAKFLGGYQYLSLATIPDTVHALTGNFMSCHDPSQYSNDKLVDWIKRECEKKHAIVCKLKHSDGNNGEYERGFAVIGFSSVNNEEYFCIRDPRKSTTDLISIEDFKRDFDMIGTFNTLQLLSKKVGKAMEYLDPSSEVWNPVTRAIGFRDPIPGTQDPEISKNRNILIFMYAFLGVYILRWLYVSAF